MANSKHDPQPRRGCFFQPKVAVLGYLGNVMAEIGRNPVGVVSIAAESPRVAEYSNPVRCNPVGIASSDGIVGAEKSMDPHVKSVRALDDYELEVSFENGECRIFDVKPFLSRGIFVRLRDRALFQAVRMVAGSVEWPGGLDLSYETLYVEGQPITEASDNPHEPPTA